MPLVSPSFRRRSRRQRSVDLPHGFWAMLVERTVRPDVLVRLGLCVAGALVLLVALQGWAEPFAFRVGSVPVHGVVSRVA